MAQHVVIVGNGITGVTAARFIRKLSDSRITVVSGETDYFYARTALMYIYMGHMRYRDTKPYDDNFWESNRIELLRGWVTKVNTVDKTVMVGGGRTLRYDKLLLATGSKPNFFGWPGQDLDGVQGLYGIPDLVTMERWTTGISRGVVVGGGLIGIEMAEMLHSRHIPVTFLVREKSYMDYTLPAEESASINAEIIRHGIDLRLCTELAAILPNKEGRARAVVTMDGDEIPCGFVGLTVGVHPNIELAKVSGIETGWGILVNEYFETNAPDVFAAGDCAEFRREGIGSRQTEQLWYTGRNHGRTVAWTICGMRRRYDRGVFFNSAKFFTLEYQTYGEIEPVPPAGVESFVWTDERKVVRIDYRIADRCVVGFNLLGVRFRHDRCEAWIRNGATVEQIMQRLSEAQFDGEFSRRIERDIAVQYKSTLRSVA